MNKNAIVFALNYYDNDNSDKNKDYYLMLCYALETLYKNLKSGIDVIVCYDMSRKPKTKYDIFENFSQAQFIEIKYEIKNEYERMFYKWFCVDHVFSKYNYDRLFILDVDVIFYQDPILFFEKYNDTKKLYCLDEAETHVEIQKVLDTTKGINGGQILLSRNIYQKFQSLHKTLLQERLDLDKRARCLDKYFYDWIMKDLSDQYCLTNLICKLNIPIDFFDVKDICYGVGCPDTKILHYFSSLSKKFLPQKLINED